ncbi:phosphoribosylanthranilate isomerase [Bacillus canaveralius]|uniref:N-(5'-phosphoribosyl)anthranilate isomerase n=1 Tax=Bacillus canaveralius TaxID=1403243 RepID=A0A2N5GIP6_9BACI|nr:MULTISPECIES: phosphoribosylanthranilate isomerase [Bacillus]PLR80889.1 phosphoribosylanthranilate isomerase [Bacillus canaveralius]PLR83385.1 phosphoribosylanthranilate isomerase [Bacillus sp. V33-4]PLR91177.1 phosphoribosylanthranilate isomerase [Bacillus canaveralius]RSK51745.1 phosphoribosylanthranilate isomerase [Bacillus canaveralius]
MKVKICGITDSITAQAAVKAGADAIGFVFAESSRRVTPEQAGAIAAILPGHVQKVGVFVNETIEQIERIANTAKLDLIQLHGDESPEFCKAISLPVVKAISISTSEDMKELVRYETEYVLLDSPKGKYRGGNGTKFNWELAAEASKSETKVILAGGLNANNVAEAIGKVDPYMVDVSSGVETDGKKDISKINRFIAIAKQAGEE